MTVTNTTKTIRVAVIGAGVMGSHHLRIYENMKGVELVGLVEQDETKARAATARFGVSVFATLEDLIGKVDAVSIASPSITHADIGSFLLAQGIHCLIEKPLAVSEIEGQALIEAARKSGATLMVGHVERFNPAVRQLAAILADGHTIHAIDARRLSAVSSRIQDVDVVSDLMVHDIDIVLSLVRQKVENVTARAVSTTGNDGDYVSAMVSFCDGALATLTASRITQNKVRELSITTDLGLIQIDYSAQQLVIYRQGDGAIKRMPGDLGNYNLDIVVERALIRNAEPLVLELQHFIDCVRTGARPLITGEDAMDALRVVWQIQKSYGAAI